MKPVLLDTGVIVSLLDRGQLRHRDCVDVVLSLARPLVTCEPVIAESCYLLRHLGVAKQRVLENVETGFFQIPFSLSQSAPEVRRIFNKYADRNVDLADACLVHLASEFRTGDILTLDSDFDVYRWGSNKPFRNLLRRG